MPLGLLAGGLAAGAAQAGIGRLFGRRSRRARRRERAAERERERQLAIEQRGQIARNIEDFEREQFLRQRQTEEALRRRGLLRGRPSEAVDISEEARRRLEETAFTPEDFAVNLRANLERLRQERLAQRRGIAIPAAAETVTAQAAPAAPPAPGSATLPGANVEQLRAHLPTLQAGLAGLTAMRESTSPDSWQRGRLQEQIQNTQAAIADVEAAIARGSAAPTPPPAPPPPAAAPQVPLTLAQLLAPREMTSSAREILGEFQRGRRRGEEETESAIQEAGTAAQFRERMRQIAGGARPGGTFREVLSGAVEQGAPEFVRGLGQTAFQRIFPQVLEESAVSGRGPRSDISRLESRQRRLTERVR
jgi:hypothetical protein